MSNNSIILGHFLPASLLQQSTPIRRLTSTSSDSEDSGVDPIKEYSSRFQFDFIVLIDSLIDKNEKYSSVEFHLRLDLKNRHISFNLMDKLIDQFNSFESNSFV